jgi:hypothetical protein
MKGPSPGIASAPIPTIQPKAPPKDRAASCASRRALGRLGILLVREILGSLVVRKQNRDIVLGEAGLLSNYRR